MQSAMVTYLIGYLILVPTSRHVLVSTRRLILVSISWLILVSTSRILVPGARHSHLAGAIVHIPVTFKIKHYC